MRQRKREPHPAQSYSCKIHVGVLLTQIVLMTVNHTLTVMSSEDHCSLFGTLFSHEETLLTLPEAETEMIKVKNIYGTTPATYSNILILQYL